MRLVIAPDKFKGSLEAAEVAAELAAGLAEGGLRAAVAEIPMADGGEGTVAAALSSGYRPLTATVSGPLGAPIDATIAINETTAVIEMAAASGLGVLPTDDDGTPRRDALAASSRGTGELIVAALDAGCRQIVLGVGGSASTDGGAGMLVALGIRLLDSDGNPVPDGGAGLAQVATAEVDSLDPRLTDTELILAADVTNPLLGAQGAAAVFAPQKGASADDVALLEECLDTLVEALAVAVGESALETATLAGAGAAGGVGFAALLLGATRRPGIEVVMDLVGLDATITGADVVITGEGSLDGQSLGGKTPLGVANRARDHQVPTVLAVCGRTTLSEAEQRAAGFDRVWALTDIEPDVERCMREAGPLLRHLGRQVAAYLLEHASHEQGATMPSYSLSNDPSLIAEVNRPERIEQQIAELRQQKPGLADVDEPVSSTERDAPYDLVIKGRRILTTAGVTEREIGIRGGKVVAVEPLGHGLKAAQTITLADDETLIPGLVDTHVHINEPGRTDWEGFASATKAAAAGGVTTIIDMPLNSIPSTVNGPALELKRLVAQGQAFVDLGFWGGAVPGNIDNLRELHDEGVFGFKCFLLHSGVDEFPHLEGDQLEEYLRVLAGYDALMIVHAEDSRSIVRAPSPDGDVYTNFLSSRPRGAENLAIAEVIERTRWTGARTHILHLSSSDALPMLASAKADGLDITVETCPHYLTLMSEEIPNGGTAYKCCPPIREVGNRERLWEGLLAGTIDYIASDHSPSTLDLKDLQNGDFAVAWGGISSVQLGLPLIWTEARRRGIPLEQVMEWMAGKPADRVRLRSKGRLSLGYDADMSIFAADDAFVVDAAKLHHKNPLTPYHGKALSGVVRRTFVRGQEVDFETPHGRLIRRGID